MFYRWFLARKIGDTPSGYTNGASWGVIFCTTIVSFGGGGGGIPFLWKLNDPFLIDWAEVVLGDW